MRLTIQIIILVYSLCYSSKENKPQINSNNDTIKYILDPIYVTGIKNKLFSILSGTAISKEDFEITTSGIAINNIIKKVPGIFALGEHNFAQDTRLSIRGNGLRSSFGIRGIKILSDGIPETTPDGQGQLDNIDIFYYEQVYISKGSISALFGNASGGSVDFITKEPMDSKIQKGRFFTNSYGTSVISYMLNRRNNIMKWNFCFTRQQFNGHRDHSSMLATIINSQVLFEWKNLANVKLHLNYLHSPYALDAGALNQQQSRTDFTMARPENINYDSKEEVYQNKVSLKFDSYYSSFLRFKIKLWSTFRNFENKLPFQNGGQVDLIRDYWGASVKSTFQFKLKMIELKTLLGFESGNQDDERKRYDNLLGQRGEMVYDANERFNYFASYFQTSIQYHDIKLFTGVRYDLSLVKFKNNANSIYNPDFKRSFDSLSPIIGFNYKYKQTINIYCNYSTHFDIPTLYELGNNVAEEESNITLEPQLSRSEEFGVKFNNETLIGLIEIYNSKIKNEIIPFEVQDEPGRFYYRNAGETIRKGAEFSFSKKFKDVVIIKYLYSISDLRFVNYQTDEINRSGNFLPLNPQNINYVDINWNLNKNYFFKIDFYRVGKIYLNDQNTDHTKPYQLINVHFKKEVKFKQRPIEITFSINNLIGIRYYSNLRANAYGNRFYEPAPGRNFSLGFMF